MEEVFKTKQRHDDVRSSYVLVQYMRAIDVGRSLAGARITIRIQYARTVNLAVRKSLIFVQPSISYVFAEKKYSFPPEFLIFSIASYSPSLRNLQFLIFFRQK